MASYRLTQEADEHLFDILVFGIDKFGPEQAHRYQIELENCFDLIARNPMLGRQIGTRVVARRHIHRQHVIFYEFDDREVTILAVINMLNLERLKDFDLEP